MIHSYLNKTVTHIKSVGSDKWGEPVTPVEATIKARILNKDLRVIDSMGVEKVSKTQVWVLLQDIGTSDKIRIGSIEYPIGSIETAQDFDDQFLKINLL